MPHALEKAATTSSTEVPVPGAQVKDLDAGLAVHPVEGGHVTRCQVTHVDVVAHTGAVGGGVIVAKDLNGLELTDGDLGDVRHQVVGDTLGSSPIRPDG